MGTSTVIFLLAINMSGEHKEKLPRSLKRQKSISIHGKPCTRLNEPEDKFKPLFACHGVPPRH